jgi:hypothetical protein
MVAWHSIGHWDLVFGHSPLLAFRRLAQHDIELGHELARLRLFHRAEIDHDTLSSFLVLDAAEHAIAIVLLVALNVALGCEKFFIAGLDFVMNMRRAVWIGDRFDRAEIILAV